MDNLRKIPILYEQKEECCGCTACFAICPQNAILMLQDAEGFLYPSVDEEKCVRCYICMKVCPMKSKNMNSLLKIKESRK